MYMCMYMCKKHANTRFWGVGRVRSGGGIPLGGEGGGVGVRGPGSYIYIYIQCIYIYIYSVYIYMYGCIP